MATDKSAKKTFSCKLEDGMLADIKFYAEESKISQAQFVANAVGSWISKKEGASENQADSKSSASDYSVEIWQRQLEIKDEQIHKLLKNVDQAQQLSAMLHQEKLLAEPFSPVTKPFSDDDDGDDDAYDPSTPEEETISKEFHAEAANMHDTPPSTDQKEDIDKAVRAALEERLADFETELKSKKGKKKKGKKSGKKGGKK